MSLKLTILGCNSAVPSISRFTTSQVLSTDQKNYLIDCGEGAQIRIRDLKIKQTKIQEIFISHLHGDHFFGLPGLITSLNLNGRTAPLTIYGPVGITAFLDTLRELGSFHLNFSLQVNELEATHPALIHEDAQLEVWTIPLQHRIPTTGFLFKEKPKPRNIIPSKIKEFQLSLPEIKLLKKGQDIHREDGSFLSNIDLTTQAHLPSSYAFCSDTIYNEDILPQIKNTTLLYHEATYLSDLSEKARERGHSTAKQAAKIAAKANVGGLVLGHYSSRYKDLSLFLDEAAEIFESVELAEDGKIFEF